MACIGMISDYTFSPKSYLIESENTVTTPQPCDAIRAVQAITDLYHRENEIYHLAARKTNLSETALLVLYDLTEEDGLTQKQLCLGNGLSKQTVNSAVKRMAEEGYLRVENCGRSSRLWLTDYGRAFAREHVEPVRAAEQEAMGTLSPDEQADLVRLYGAYVSALSDAIAKL
ncbi:MAG: MarR family transcriptional regulator [Adlercreutzia sp.]|uniref:MarR family winged helix-turn-helix transcriptional regulator n=2 Tax=uncultured Adlercreutzia sp. TaxID=875803 RepID=UPI0021703E53|nr:MarR family transcriptional regulator [uncultured Adlercreutzia sp.]MCI8425384.1 MarR family transcriptional regulator [Adlercreutzia sp.]